MRRPQRKVPPPSKPARVSTRLRPSETLRPSDSPSDANDTGDNEALPAPVGRAQQTHRAFAQRPSSLTDPRSTTVPRQTAPRAITSRAAAPRAIAPRAPALHATAPRSAVPRATAPRATTQPATAQPTASQRAVQESDVDGEMALLAATENLTAASADVGNRKSKRLAAARGASESAAASRQKRQAPQQKPTPRKKSLRHSGSFGRNFSQPGGQDNRPHQCAPVSNPPLPSATTDAPALPSTPLKDDLDERRVEYRPPAEVTSNQNGNGRQFAVDSLSPPPIEYEESLEVNNPKPSEPLHEAVGSNAELQPHGQGQSLCPTKTVPQRIQHSGLVPSISTPPRYPTTQGRTSSRKFNQRTAPPVPRNNVHDGSFGDASLNVATQNAREIFSGAAPALVGPVVPLLGIGDLSEVDDQPERNLPIAMAGGSQTAPHSSLSDLQRPLRQPSRRASQGIDTMVIKVDEYNSMKKRLKSQENTIQLLTTCGQTLHTEINKLRRELNAARVAAECVASSIPSSTASLNESPASSAPKRKATSKLRSRDVLSLEFRNNDLSLELSRAITTFSDDASSFAHYFTAEVCDSRWEALLPNAQWAPNASSAVGKILRDWRGRTVTNPDFVVLENVDSDVISSIGAPLLTVDNSDPSSIKVTDVFYPFCPFDEAHLGTCFTFTRDAVINFITQSVLSVVKGSNLTLATPHADIVLSSFVQKSEALYKRFIQACSQVVNNRKMNARNFFFKSLGYGRIFNGSIDPSQSEEWEARVNEMKDASKKLNVRLESGVRDTGRWRTAELHEICAVDFENHEQAGQGVNGIDTLFRNEQARRAFRKYRKFPVEPGDDTSILHLVRFDAILTSAVDGIVAELKTIENRQQQQTEDIESSSRKRLGQKGGTIPQDSAERLRLLLPVAAGNLLRHCYDCLACARSLDYQTVKKELSLSGYQDREDILGNCSRYYTIAFRYPRNGNFYIALRTETFNDLVCAWIGLVYDCYILYSRAPGADVQHFDGSSPLDPVNESDEEIDVGTSDACANSVPCDFGDEDTPEDENSFGSEGDM